MLGLTDGLGLAEVPGLLEGVGVDSGVPWAGDPVGSGVGTRPGAGGDGRIGVAAGRCRAGGPGGADGGGEVGGATTGGTMTMGSRDGAARAGVPGAGRSPTEAAPIAITTKVGTEAKATSTPTIAAYLRPGPATP
jgi:hypothetical protein